jgi:hypothetical protein
MSGQEIGFLGLGWAAKIAKEMGMKWSTPIGGTKAETYISKLYSAYKTAVTKEKYPIQNVKALKSYISSATRETPERVELFLETLKRLALAGSVPYSAYDPAQAASKKVFDFGKSLVDKVIIAGSLVGAAYLLVPKLLKERMKVNGN